MMCSRRTNDENSDSNSSKSEDDDELKDSLNAFLTSSLNVELVYTILKGIISAANQEDLETWKNGQIPVNSINDFSFRINLDRIEIQNFKAWEDSKQQEFMSDPNLPFETNLDYLMSKQEQEVETLIIEKNV